MNHCEPLNYYLDSEFIETGETIELISIGLVCEDGREYYAEVDEVPWEKADDWVLQNVKPYLHGYPVRSKDQLAKDLVRFISRGERAPQFWAYYADYDWVVLCRLYGRMLNLPTTWPKYCMDLKQEVVNAGNPKLPRQTSTEHNALMDARWVRDTYLWLMEKRNDV